MEEAPIPSDSLHTEPISSIRVMHPDNNTVHGDQTTVQGERSDLSSSEEASAVNGPLDNVATASTSDEDANRAQDTDSPPPELSPEKKAAIVKQIEYYFSDENLPSDKFMMQKLKTGGHQGWVNLQVIASFNKLKKISNDVRVIASALEDSAHLVLRKKGPNNFRVRRKTRFKFPDKDGISDLSARTVLAVNIPPDSSVESLTAFFSACGTVETVRIFRKSDPKNKDIQPPVGASRDFYATCQFSTAEEAIKAMNELTDRQSWRGGLRVTLANGMNAEKASAKLKAAAAKKSNVHKQEQDEIRSPARSGSRSPHPEVQPRKRPGAHPSSPTDAESHHSREGQARSRSLTELELENAAANGGGSDSSEAGEAARKASRKPRSESNVDALFKDGDGECSPPRYPSGYGEKGPFKGVVQSVSEGGWSWIKREGGGSRKAGHRVPFLSKDVVTKEGEPRALQKGDHVEFRTWKDKDGTQMAVRVEKKERTRLPTGVSGGTGGQRRTDRATQAHFRMAIGPLEGSCGFAIGRGRRIDPVPTQLSSVSGKWLKEGGQELSGVASGCDGAARPEVDGGGEIIRRPRGSSMGGPESKVFVPATGLVPDPSQFEDAVKS